MRPRIPTLVVILSALTSVLTFPLGLALLLWNATSSVPGQVSFLNYLSPTLVLLSSVLIAASAVELRSHASKTVFWGTLIVALCILGSLASYGTFFILYVPGIVGGLVGARMKQPS